MLFQKCDICETLVGEIEQDRQKKIMLHEFGFVDNKCLCSQCRNENMEIKNLLKESVDK
jgi:hypothetical protein